jgi:hypothetical protein
MYHYDPGPNSLAFFADSAWPVMGHESTLYPEWPKYFNVCEPSRRPGYSLTNPLHISNCMIGQADGSISFDDRVESSQLAKYHPY